ncbi:MAG: glycosyltransferase [Bacteroidales bacterium]|nr:glycosyltransferase [Bacteroidales bacterium]
MTSKISAVMVLPVSITLLFVVVYSTVVLLLSRGLKQLKKVSIGESVKPVPVTLVIPFRNEKVRLPVLVRDLLQQSYPEDQFEVIFINDHSEDGSKALLNSLLHRRSRFSCMDLPAGQSGKKEALLHGNSQVRTEWIIQTDADCRLGPHFIATHMAFLEEYPSDLVAGLVTTRNGSGGLLEIFERMDLLSLAGSGAGSFYYGRPLMCNGANLLYSKKLFFETRDFDPAGMTPSGDDMFLMIGARKLGRKMSFSTAREAMVETIPAQSLGSLITQRIRWGSKSVHYGITDIQLLAVVVAFTNVLLLFSPIWLLLDPELWPWLLSALVIKILADFKILYTITGCTGQRRILRLFLPVWLIYYFYLPVVLTGMLFRQSGWKGRRY